MAFLQIVMPNGQVRKVPLRGDRLVVGRSAEADVVVADRRVSRRHAAVERRAGGGWLLRDLGSTNKTFVRRQAISSHMLADGDVFAIGDTRVKFVASSPAPAAAPAPTEQTASRGPVACPCCEQVLTAGARICVRCGIDVHSGRSIMTVQTDKLDEIYTYAESVIRWISWIVWLGIYPIASEAFGLRKPWVTRGIAAVTVVVSVWFMAAYVYNPHPDPALGNLMLWSGSAEARQQQIEELRDQLRSRRVNEKQIDSLLERAGISEKGTFRACQLLTCALLHGGPIHLAGNMLFLMVLGSRVNALIGNVLTVLLYPLLAIAAGMSHVIAMAEQPLHPMLGASGAVMGLAGMYLVLMPTPNVHMAAWLRWGLIGGFHLSFKTFAVRGFWAVLFYIAFDVVYTVLGLEDQVAHWAHLGGFLTGAILALILLLSRLVNARGGDILTAIFGKYAWRLVGKPNRQAPALW